MADGQPMAPGAPQQGGGGATKLVSDINSKLIELMSMLESSGAVTDEDKSELANVIDHYQSFVETNLGSGPGAKPEPKGQVPSPIPMGGGTDQFAGGNPNAIPVHG